MIARTLPATIAALCLLAMQSVPVEAEVVSLATLEKLALNDRAALVADAARARAASAEIEKASGGYNPKLSLEAQSGVSPGGSLVAVAAPDSNQQYLVRGAPPLASGHAFDPQFVQELGLEFRTTLYDFGRTSTAVDASRARHAASLAAADATRAAIVHGVRTAYLAWLGASELQAIAAQAATDAENRRIHLEALIAEGVKPRADLSPARADEMFVRLERERALGELRAAKLALEQTVGKPLSDTAEPDTAFLQRDVANAGPVSDATLRVLAGQREAASKMARMQDKADAPVLTGKLSAGIHAQDTTAFPAYAVGVGFSLPLWDGGGSDAGAAAARAHADELRAMIRERREQNRSDFERARLDAANAASRLASAEELLEVCTTRLAEAEQSYELAAGSEDQVAQARSMLRRARSEVVQARLARADAALRMSGP